MKKTKKKDFKKKDFKNAPNPGVLKAIEIAGSQMKLAEAMNVAQPAIYHWLYYKCPPNRAKDIEDRLGIPKSETCPEVFD